jgi:hypothetical protein
MKGRPYTKEELEDLRSRFFTSQTVSRLLATIDERDETILQILEELHYLRSLFDEKRPSQVIHFWLNKSIDKFKPDETTAQLNEEPSEEE